MSLRCHGSASANAIAWPAAAGLALLMLAGCDRETRDYRGRPLPETGPVANDPRGSSYEGNAFHIAQGQRLYGWMNCIGCHAHGGGGMGPALRDANWRYGGSMADIVTTILDGRPNGMPSFRGRITETQAWQLAAFVRAMSAQPRQDALPARADELRNTEPLTLDARRRMYRTTPKADKARDE